MKNYKFIYFMLITPVVIVNSVFCQIDTSIFKSDNRKHLPIIKGSDNPNSYKLNRNTLYEYKDIYVFIEPHKETGEDIYIVNKNNINKPINDKIMKDEYSYMFKSLNADYFFGIYKNFMFIDSGTGPGLRGLTIIDIIKKKTVFQTASSDPEIDRGKNILSYWDEIGYASKDEINNDKELLNFFDDNYPIYREQKILIDLNDFSKSETDIFRFTVGQ